MGDVEIGMGRSARQTYTLDDVSIVPSRRTRSSSMVSTSWQIDAYRFELPMLNHPSDAIASPAVVKEIGRLGGLGVLNAEGIWARYADPEAALARVLDSAREDDAELPRAATELEHVLSGQAVEHPELRVGELPHAPAQVVVADERVVLPLVFLGPGVTACAVGPRVVGQPVRRAHPR